MTYSCEQCGIVIDGLPFKCKYCGYHYCMEHRIPENHDCLFNKSKGHIPQESRVSGTYYKDTDMTRHRYERTQSKRK